MNPKGEAGQPDWNRDHSHGNNGMGWGGLMNETNQQAVGVFREWSGRKTASVRSIPNSDS